ncbi:hypothetical protein HZH68_002999 [Vespula germanica]|uniref:Uncharacterized protein n=2 Tax=Vespula TaxID=7451 RepID=A0A834U1Z7_VESGE|nr:hypothetical protein HZH68_002999 [Vespula germanica]KAF7435132.1 hypothetical protein H0235_003323 [Vespula pensylvanica]
MMTSDDKHVVVHTYGVRLIRGVYRRAHGRSLYQALPHLIWRLNEPVDTLMQSRTACRRGIASSIIQNADRNGTCPRDSIYHRKLQGSDNDFGRVHTLTVVVTGSFLAITPALYESFLRQEIGNSQWATMTGPTLRIRLGYAFIADSGPGMQRRPIEIYVIVRPIVEII